MINVSEQLEALVDRPNGLLDVLVALECICSEKADHLRVNWQDKVSARQWDAASRAIGKCLRSDAVSNIP